MHRNMLFVASYALLLPFVAGEPAIASVPPVLDPVEMTFERNDTREGGVIWRNFTHDAWHEEFCLRDRLFCVGPYEIGPYTVNGPRVGGFVENDLWLYGGFDQSWDKAYGPYRFDMPVGDDLRFCWHNACFLPDPVRGQAHTSTNVTLYAHTLEVHRGVDARFNASDPAATWWQLR